MNESSTQQIQQVQVEKGVINRNWIWILLAIITLVIIGVIILIVLLVKHKKDNDSKKEKAKNPESTWINTEEEGVEEKGEEEEEEKEEEEEMADYDQMCLLLQALTFVGREPNSFSPREEPKEELREDGVYVKTEVNFGEQFPNSYLDIYYPGEKEEDRPTYIYWHGGGHIFGDKNLGDPLSPNSDTTMHMFAYIYKQGFNFISVNYCFAPKYRYPAQIIQYDQVLEYLNNHSK